jgi:hypothetical protein
MRLGKHPPKLDPHTLRLGAVLDEARADPPPAVVPVPEGVAWGMYQNDVHADCTCAAVAHMIENWDAREVAYAHTAPTDALVLDLYARVNGGQDEGAFALDVLHEWRTHGLGPDTITGFAKVDHNNLDRMRYATWVFGGLYIGLDLPLTAEAQGHATWSYLPSAGGHAAKGSWGGHAVDVVGYDPEGVTIVTWGRLQRMTWGFWSRYCDEAFAVFDYADWLGDVPGFDLPKLQKALASL